MEQSRLLCTFYFIASNQHTTIDCKVGEGHSVTSCTLTFPPMTRGEDKTVGTFSDSPSSPLSADKMLKTKLRELRVLLTFSAEDFVISAILARFSLLRDRKEPRFGI